MMRIRRGARALVAVFAMVLLVPILGIPTQDERGLQYFHLRLLHPWPAATELVRQPVGYFATARAWLGDRVYPIVKASWALKNLEFFALRSAPQRNLSLGEDDFVFINDARADQVNHLLTEVCVNAHTPESAQALAAALERLARYARAQGTKVDVVAVPVLATVYGDRLPDSIPTPLRRACAAVTRTASPLSQVPVPDGVHFVYPMAQMLAARDDPGFYPRANWHAAGLSVRTARNAYLAAIGVSRDIPETLTPSPLPSELLARYGIVHAVPAYRVRNDHVVADHARRDEWTAGIKDLFAGGTAEAYLYTNSAPPSAESALMLADSFGTNAVDVFAGAFATLFEVNANTIAPENLPVAVDRLMQVHSFDRIILLVHEGNLPRIVAAAEAFEAYAKDHAGAGR